MVDVVQAGRGVSDYPGIYPIATGTVLANISGTTALPVAVTVADLAAYMGTPSYQGTWNASTNSPALASSVGTNGFYYVVSVAGTTTLNGISDWSVGDWAIYNSTTAAWQKIEGGATTITAGTTVITGGTNTRVLFDDSGVIGESAGLTYVKASGLLASTAMAIGGATIGSNALAVTGTTLLTGGLTLGGNFNLGGNEIVMFTGRSRVSDNGNGTILFRTSDGTAGVNFGFTTDGIVTLRNIAGTDFTRLQFGGTTSSFPALKRSGTTAAFRLADDSADAPITAAAATFSGAVTVPGVNTAALTSTSTFTSGAGAQVGTLTNAPAAGNPTSWIKIVDNGTTRYIPAW